MLKASSLFSISFSLTNILALYYYQQYLVSCTTLSFQKFNLIKIANTYHLKCIALFKNVTYIHLILNHCVRWVLLTVSVLQRRTLRHTEFNLLKMMEQYTSPCSLAPGLCFYSEQYTASHLEERGISN